MPYDLTILAAIEEEEGAEPSAAELKEICDLARTHEIPMLFTEKTERIMQRESFRRRPAQSWAYWILAWAVMTERMNP